MEWKDPYLRYVHEVKPRRGLSPVEEYALTPFKQFTRYYENASHGNHHSSTKVFRRDDTEILCQGAALAFDKLGTVRHAWAGRGLLGFAGFLAENLEEARAAVRTRGAIILTVEGVSRGCEGLTVYAEAPDKFSLSNVGIEIGKIRFIEDMQKGRVSVAFKAWDDPEPLDLRVSRHGRKEE